MKLALRFAALCIIALGAAVVYLVAIAHDMPVKWYDEQGSRVATVIEREFDIPIDPISDRKGIYHYGWAYRQGGTWHTGSNLTIYGVKDRTRQDIIINRISDLVRTNNLNDIRVTFYDNAKFEKRDNVTVRIEVPELRQKRICGKRS